MSRLTRLLVAALYALALTVTGSLTPASGSDTGRVTAAPSVSLVAMTSRTTALARAKTKEGGWYRYGGNGPRDYDCSGLVYYAYRHQLPRVSGAQRSSGKTVHVSRYKALPGDLVFWGSGHVELLAKRPYRRNGRWYTMTFGAHHSGTRIGYRTNAGVPHIEHVRGAG